MHSVLKFLYVTITLLLLLNLQQGWRNRSWGRGGGRTPHRVPENKILFKKSKSGLITLVIIKQKAGEHV